MNLAFIITGKLSVFFHTKNFSNMVNNTFANYKNILFICVANTNDNIDYINLKMFFNNTNNIIINYTTYQNEFNEILKAKQLDNNYIKLKEQYKNQSSHALNEIKDPKDYLSAQIQFHQLQVGLKALKEYEANNNIKYDFICKTRFDINYPENFYPHIPTDKLFFNNLNKIIIEKSMNNLNLKNIDDLIEFNKKNKIILPDCRINNQDEKNVSFGGSYSHNFKNLEKLKNGCNDFIYSFNDYFYFGKADMVLKLYDMFNESLLIEPDIDNEELYNHLYSPESQLLIYCYKKDINILMYYNNSYSIIRPWELYNNP